MQYACHADYGHNLVWIDTHRHTYLRMHTHTNTHMHARTHTHTQTHTHTLCSVLCSLQAYYQFPIYIIMLVTSSPENTVYLIERVERASVEVLSKRSTIQFQPHG